MFQPATSLQVACKISCSIEIARAKKAKKDRKERKQALLGLQPKSYWIKRAQSSFNAFVRLRDQRQPCISCGRHHEGQYHAGHYRTTAAHPELRFEESNCHRQCAPCNNHKSGDIVNYRRNLQDKIGQERVNWIEGPHEPKHYTIEDLKGIEKLYKDKTKELRE